MMPAEASKADQAAPPAQAPVAIVHDYLTQRGGAERVVLALATEAFPGAPVHTSMYDPEGTFTGFSQLEVHTLWLDRIGWLRRHHRLSLPLLGWGFSSLEVPAQVAVCSSSGWAHRARVAGRKVVYCHSPARWLYQPERYLGAAYRLVGSPWELYTKRARLQDRRAALSAHRYVVNSSAVRDRVRDLYQIDAEVVAPPVSFGAFGPEEPVAGVEPGF
ncbi:MAG TPA: hypothetical protein VKY15_08665, partial [Acidimicrobiales bacterium]|nr:hypothetical protein [Acidimicrobiales bacterium]